MKKKTIVFSVVLIVVLSSSVFANKPITFEERVKAQEAIEKVYYNHRIWPKENPQPKPPFEKMVTKEQIEAKVTDYLKKCSALDQFWQRPIIASQLQAEMDRMAKGTKDAATLNELFAALNNDSYLIAECLARPVLAEKLVAEKCPDEIDMSCILEKYNGKQVRYEADHTGEFSIAFSQPGLLADGVCTEVWQDKLKTSSGMPSARRGHTAIWTGAEMIIWGGGPTFSSWSNTGGKYYPATDSWSATSTGTDCPAARSRHRAVWTGSEMIVWGGEGSSYINSGGRYNPLSDTWTPTSTGANCPTYRYRFSAVWTGSVMVIWGGYAYPSWTVTNTGAMYNPSTDTWQSTSTGTDCPSSRWCHTAVWTGSVMIVWGGQSGSNFLNSGGIFYPAGNYWRTISTGAGCPSSRYLHSAVWTGSKMIVWGGTPSLGTYFNTGGVYDPVNDSWKATSTGTSCPTARSTHSSVWTGMEMIVWGGWWYDTADRFENTGGKYNPWTDAWIETPTDPLCPIARCDHTAVMISSAMAVWGGTPVNDAGGIYEVKDLKIEQASPVCEGENFVLKALPVVSGASYQWYKNGSVISGATGTELTAGEDVEYNFRIDDSPGSWCYSPKIKPEFTNPTPYITGPSSFCWSALLSTQPYYSYQWYLDGEAISGATSRECSAEWPGIYTVAAYTEDGCGGVSSAFGLAAPPSPTINNNTAYDADICANSGILINWSAPTWNDTMSDGRSFSVLRDGVVMASGLPSTQYSYTDTTSAPDVAYLYQVRFINGCRSVATTLGTTATDIAPPFLPSGFSNNSATDMSSCDRGIRVGWNRPVNWGDCGYGTRSYTVLRDGAVLVVGVSEFALSYTDTTCVTGVSYLYQITAVNGYGLTSTTAGASASDAGSSTLGEIVPFNWSGGTISWPSAPTATGYKLYRGIRADLANLMNSTAEGCIKYDGISTAANCSADDPSLQTGRFYWYLVTAYDGPCEGTAGEGTGFLRNLTSSTTCP